MSDTFIKDWNNGVGKYICDEYNYNDYSVNDRLIIINNYTFEKMYDDLENIKEKLDMVYTELFGLDYEIKIFQYENNIGEYMEIWVK